jgi:hypothetical protein
VGLEVFELGCVIFTLSAGECSYRCQSTLSYHFEPSLSKEKTTVIKQKLSSHGRVS